MKNMVAGNSWRTSVREYSHPRVVGVFFMGISSGFPLTLLLSSLGFWLIDEGVSKSTIGLLTLSLVPYFLKFIWAPALDSLRLPLLHKFLGRRRSWFVVIQVGLAFSIIGLASASPGDDPVYFGLMAMIVCFMSASQDLVIDAYRIEILKDEEMPAGAAMTQFGYRVGNLIAGVVTLKFADWYGWDVAYMSMPLLLLFGLVPILIFGEPILRGKHLIEKEMDTVRGWMSKDGQQAGTYDKIVENIYMTVIVPFKEFIQRPGWWVILLFILLLKVGDSMAAVMTAPLIGDLGFSKDEIIWANKTVGFVAVLLGAFCGGVVLNRLGTYRGLMVAAVLMMVTNLSFAVLAENGRNLDLLVFTIGFENFATGMGGTIAIAYLSGLCNKAYTVTQYALLSAFASLGRLMIGAPSGFMQESIGYTEFFLLTTVAAVPGIVLLIVMNRMGYVGDRLTLSGDNSKD
ncbi:MAG: MFS transporter [Emcibacter sp.]|nr:MFS transporter [Emcibacter sp.]